MTKHETPTWRNTQCSVLWSEALVVCLSWPHCWMRLNFGVSFYRLWCYCGATRQLYRRWVVASDEFACTSPFFVEICYAKCVIGIWNCHIWCVALRLCELIFIVHIVINLLSRTIASEMRSFIQWLLHGCPWGTFLWHGFAMSRDVVVTNVGFDCAAKKKWWGGESPSIIQERELNGL